MEILTKSYGWLEVETDFLFDDQYNCTVNGKGVRVMDSDVIRIKNDIRKGKLHCHWCGFTGSPEEFKKHLEQDEARVKSCNGCKYYDFREVSTNIVDTQKKDETSESYTETSTLIKVFKRRCCNSYCPSREHIKQVGEPLKGYFIDNPDGCLFNDWKYAKYLQGDILKMDVLNYTFEFNVINGDIKLYNRKTLYNFNACVGTNRDGDPYLWFCSSSDWKDGFRSSSPTRKKLYNKVHDVIEDIIDSRKKFNNIVTQDSYYKNPDGSDYNVGVNGKKRPLPLSFTFGASESNTPNY